MKRMKNDPDMLEEYDFTGGVRGKYAKRYAEGTNVVVIDPDVAGYFPDQESVNEALRGLTAIIKRQRRAEQEYGGDGPKFTSSLPTVTTRTCNRSLERPAPHFHLREVLSSCRRFRKTTGVHSCTLWLIKWPIQTPTDRFDERPGQLPG